jgi:hypothetical protein
MFLITSPAGIVPVATIARQDVRHRAPCGSGKPRVSFTTDTRTITSGRLTKREVFINQDLFYGHLQEHRDAANKEVAHEQDTDLDTIERNLTMVLSNVILLSRLDGLDDIPSEKSGTDFSAFADERCQRCMNHFELFEGYDVKSENKIRLRDAILNKYGADIFTHAMRSCYESEAAAEAEGAHESEQQKKTLCQINLEWKNNRNIQ